MLDNHLVWKEVQRRDVFSCRVFTVHESVCEPPPDSGTCERGVFTVIDGPDWAIVLPILEKDGEKFFVMVKQWRHGAREISLEFPGGVFESGENPSAAALRELEEETAFTAGKITKIGEMSPNPAIMSNHVHFFLAEDLAPLPSQHLDADEFVDAELIPCAEVVKNMGNKPYIHALMGTALSLYLAHNALKI